MRRATRSIRSLTLAVSAVTALGLITAPAAGAATGDLGSTLSAGDKIAVGQYLSNGSTTLKMQSDGNLVMYNGSTAVFTSATQGTGSANYAAFQADGNFVVYNSAREALWKTVTNGSGATRATLQADGNFVIYAGSTAKWATETYGGRNELENSKIYAKALSLVGQYDYKYGAGHGSSPGPTNGQLDCSGFVRWVYSMVSGHDIMKGDTNAQILLANRHDSVAAPGTLIFYSDTGSTSNTHHVGVYAGNGHLISEWSSGYKTLINSVNDSGGTQLKYYSRSW